MTPADWHFDFVSPLAGLLKHWGQKGPAELARRLNAPGLDALPVGAMRREAS